MDITNKTTKPLSLSLPGGKKLFLAPGKTGQVTPKALKHPPIEKLLEAGDIEISGDGAKNREGGGNNAGPSGAGSRFIGSGAMRQSGDR